MRSFIYKTYTPKINRISWHFDIVHLSLMAAYYLFTNSTITHILKITYTISFTSKFNFWKSLNKKNVNIKMHFRFLFFFKDWCFVKYWISYICKCNKLLNKKVRGNKIKSQPDSTLQKYVFYPTMHIYFHYCIIHVYVLNVGVYQHLSWPICQ